jgi:hypothetical protein
MPTMSRLFRRAVPWTCLLLAAVTAAGCGTPGFTYAADTSAGAYFKVPFGWHKIDAASLTSQFNSVNRGFGDQNGLWDVAYDASGAPSAVHLLNPTTSEPFAFAFVLPLSTKASGAMSYDLLRNFILPVTSAARSAAAQSGFSLKDFLLLKEVVIHGGQGVHGVRDIFEYTYPNGLTQIFDQVALTNPDATIVYLLMVQCVVRCYAKNFSEINTVMTSFTVRSV